MVYGDTADLPWGRERFEPGAFGTLSRADVVLDMQHDRTKPLARTGGSGLSLDDSDVRLEINATITETPTGDEALQLVKDRILRGLSVLFRPTEWRIEDGDIFVVEKADLLAIGVVDKPAYKKATINNYRAMMVQARAAETTERDVIDVTPEEIREAIRQEFANRRSDDDNEGLITRLAEIFQRAVDRQEAQLDERIQAAVDRMTAERDQARQEAETAEAEARAAEERAAEERANIEAEAEQRAQLIVMVQDLLPDDYDTTGQTRHQILIAAAGDEVENAADRSADYLEARIEAILERRADANNQRNDNRRNNNQRNNGPIEGGALDPIKIRELARAAQAS